MIHDQLPIKKALAFIFFTTLLLSGSVAFALSFYKSHKRSLYNDPHFTIVAIIQSCSNKETLQTSYLAELLGLSIDRPTNLFRFNLEEGQQKLAKCPLIKSSEIKIIKPGMLHIEYSLRMPIGYVKDFTNAAIDSEGILIPFKPFFTPKNIPELILGLSSDAAWGENVLGEEARLAQKILEQVSKESICNGCALKRIDVSKAFSKRYGEREIVLLFEKKGLSIVRLSPNNWVQQLKNYAKLSNTAKVVDMRLSQVAFIKE